MKKQGLLDHGWWVVIACTLIAIWGGVFSYGFTAYVKPIADETKWSYFIISSAMSLRLAELGLIAPVAGMLTDKIGAGKVLLLGGLFCGSGAILLSQVNSIPMFYAAFAILALGSSGLGQSVTTTALIKWFTLKRLGIATGIVVSGYGFSGFLIPPVNEAVIAYGWRGSLIIIGVITYLVAIIAAYLTWQRKQEQPEPVTTGQNSKSALPNPSSSVKTEIKLAVRTKIFWILAFILPMQFMAWSAMNVHMMPYAMQIGLSNNTASFFAMALVLSTVLGRLGGGWLTTIANPVRILIIGLCLQTAAYVLIYTTQQSWTLPIFIILFGPTFGTTIVLRAIIVRSHFSVRIFGAIQGLLIGMTTIGGIIGPAYAGWVFDHEGGYRTVWLVMAAASLIALIVSTLANRKSGSLREQSL